MPLPKIATPTYELVLPSSNRKIKFRPFLVKEEKILRKVARKKTSLKRRTYSKKMKMNSRNMPKLLEPKEMDVLNSSVVMEEKNVWVLFVGKCENAFGSIVET